MRILSHTNFLFFFLSSRSPETDKWENLHHRHTLSLFIFVTYTQHLIKANYPEKTKTSELFEVWTFNLGTLQASSCRIAMIVMSADSNEHRYCLWLCGEGTGHFSRNVVSHAENFEKKRKKTERKSIDHRFSHLVDSWQLSPVNDFSP